MKFLLGVFVAVFLQGFVWSQDNETERFSNETLGLIDEFRNGWFPKGRSHQPAPFEPTKEQNDWWNSIGGGGSTMDLDPDSSTEGHSRVKRSWWDEPMPRKEYRKLTRQERECFHRALLAMKRNMIGDISEYDMFVSFHQSQNAPAAHFGAAFLTWHREFLFRFELAMQVYCPTISLPYWDSRLEQPLENPQDSIMWAPNFMGNSQGVVTTGPFASNWEILGRCRRRGNTGLVRNEGNRRQNDALFEDRDVQRVMRKTSYEDLVYPNTFEMAHGGPHVYVGGHMLDIVCSPCDPVFFMHHAMVDCIFEQFRNKSQLTNQETEYPDPPVISRIGGRIHRPRAEMKPFQWMQNWNGLSKFYENFYYCAPFSESCRRASDCGSPYLWCHRGRCASKVRRDGDCSGFPQTAEPCQCGMCRSGICSVRPSEEAACDQ